MRSIISVAAIAMVASIGLTACGSSPPDRALSGAGIGAAAGAAGGALTGGSPVAGALIGGAGGAAVGGLTDTHDFDLGKPLWKR
jgi:osmotically inducible lipoprotein OsmB